MSQHDLFDTIVQIVTDAIDAGLITSVSREQFETQIELLPTEAEREAYVQEVWDEL